MTVDELVTELRRMSDGQGSVSASLAWDPQAMRLQLRLQVERRGEIQTLDRFVDSWELDRYIPLNLASMNLKFALAEMAAHLGRLDLPGLRLVP